MLLPGDTSFSPVRCLAMEPFADAVTEDMTGVILALEVSPGSDQPGFFTGFDPWRRSIRCTVRSPPTRGKANRELIESVARAFGLPRASVHLISGAAQHRKRVRITGLSREAVLEGLGRLLGKA